MCAQRPSGWRDQLGVDGRSRPAEAGGSRPGHDGGASSGCGQAFAKRATTPGCPRGCPRVPEGVPQATASRVRAGGTDWGAWPPGRGPAMTVRAGAAVGTSPIGEAPPPLLGCVALASGANRSELCREFGIIRPSRGGESSRCGCMHGTLQVTSLTRKAMGGAEEGQGSAPGPRRGLCPLDPHQRRSLWDPSILVGGRKGDWGRLGCRPSHRRPADAKGGNPAGPLPPSSPQPTGGFQGLRPWRGSKGQSPLVGVRGRSPWPSSAPRIAVVRRVAWT